MKKMATSLIGIGLLAIIAGAVVVSCSRRSSEQTIPPPPVASKNAESNPVNSCDYRVISGQVEILFVANEGETSLLTMRFHPTVATQMQNIVGVGIDNEPGGSVKISNRAYSNACLATEKIQQGSVLAMNIRALTTGSCASTVLVFPKASAGCQTF